MKTAELVARVVLAAPGSGCGKTTAATGLISALRRAGHRVAPFKVGPDYIDPGYHSIAAGRPGRNLDPVLVGEERIAPLFAHGSADADIAVIEGVMGLFDGRSGTPSFGSTAHVAKLLDAPVVLVVDARGQGRSLAALLHGFRGFDPEVRLAGVLLNNVGSPHHEQVLRDACDEVGLDVVGCLPRRQQLDVPSRHLGLVTAVEHGAAALDAVAAMGDLVAESVDLEAVVRLARSAPRRGTTPWKSTVDNPVAGRPVVAVAGGRAFTFGYAEHLELLEAAGAEVVPFDPLRDEHLPERTAGLLLPGGFPEQHAAELSANTVLRKEVADLGRPVHAECGGLLYLARSLDGMPMCGVLDAEAEMTSRLVLGYRDAVAATDSPVGALGERRTGHEFHRTRITPGAGAQPAWFWRDREGRPVREGFAVGGVHASYLHTHPAAAPESVRRFVERCAM
ncbi:cobyrinate a,c-diamide synthase [Allokutzneria multivorans]|uniref:Hydrogenobyrinate a,c-diamide synthase n=1 Tax=Allokutzneria multivorans TaxID=1142134 RepID=A0ABP7TIE8_9PSEU